MILQNLSNFSFLPRLAVIAFAGFLLSACASNGANEAADDDFGADDDAFWGEVQEEDDNDPFETPNRFIFAFNETIDVFLLKPAAETYRFWVPDVMRDAVQNFFRNIRSPVVLANNVFQGDEPGVNNTVTRFALNSTLGVLGLFDVATEMGYPYEDEDFGLTLGSYEVGSGPYIVLPLFGPSSVRDGIGRGVDALLDPLTYFLTTEQSAGRLIITGVDTRSRHIDQIEDLQRDSVDFYARIRSLYQQNRQKEVEERIERRTASTAAMPEAALQSLEQTAIIRNRIVADDLLDSQ